VRWEYAATVPMCQEKIQYNRQPALKTKFMRQNRKSKYRLTFLRGFYTRSREYFAFNADPVRSLNFYALMKLSLYI
jgi:hypothetical protein